MSYMHLPSGSREEAAHWNFPLGIPGFRFADLNRVRRLMALDQIFLAELENRDRSLAERYRLLREGRGRGVDPTELSDTLIEVGRHLNDFVARLFHIEDEVRALDERAREDAVIFDARRNFLERRVWKEPVSETEVATCNLNALESEYRKVVADVLKRSTMEDPERELGKVAVNLLDLEEKARASGDPIAVSTVAAQIDTVGRWARALALHPTLKPRTRDWSIFFRPEKLDYMNLVERLFDNPGIPEQFSGPLETRRQRDGFRLTDPRMNPRQALGEMHYCILCHERKKDSCSHGFPEGTPTTIKTRESTASEAPAGKPQALAEKAGTSPVSPVRAPARELEQTGQVPEAGVRSQTEAATLVTAPAPETAAPGPTPDGSRLTTPAASLRGKEPGPIGFLPRYRKNPLGIPLAGCPLDEKISEMHSLKRGGFSVSALAMIMVDNPMCGGTGHRICNDCMKGCIYQKQSPVNIPQAETSILTQVLQLPYGFEIYSLFTRWNPLNLDRPYPLPYNGRKVLVVGMGPAGYTLAHWLLNEGFGVVGIDGMKIEPLSKRMRGAKRRVPQPIKDISQVTGPLDQRTILGFGGVSEYGITVRWDKNFLDINYVVLMRRKKFRLYDGVRFGGTITIEDAWDLGFDHIAIATGAGRPTLADVKNNLLRGVRAASDFLMGLQGTGIYRKRSLGNLQVQLPAVVIGGGLTAIDTATELQAYYVVQVEKTIERYERLAGHIPEARIRARFDNEELEILDTWLVHGREVRAEREAARAQGRPPDFNKLVRQWGGVSIAYRKRMVDSPAYRLNHEEIIKALEEGIRFAECLSPVEFVPGPTGAVESVILERQELTPEGKWRSTGETVTLPARSVMVAAGTHPNAIYEKEHPGTFRMDKWGEFFQGHRLVAQPDRDGELRHGQAGGTRTLEPVSEKESVGFFTSYEKDGRYITFYGDNHPVYAGNVVKAMASAKYGYREVVRLFDEEFRKLDPADQPDRELEFIRFVERLDNDLKSTVVDVLRLTPTIVEIIVRSPRAAKNFRPGQFYRLQNYENHAERVSDFLLSMEGIALTGAWVDRERGLLSMIVLEMGGSSRLCALLEPGEEVVVMGPTGTPTEIPENETVLLAGGGLGNAVLFSIAAALKEKGNRVIYFAGYKKPQDLYKRQEIEKACDLIIWSVDVPPAIPVHRPQDRTFVGNIVQAIDAYASGKLGPIDISIRDVDRIITIGSDRMMAAVKTARRGILACHLADDHKAIASINSPMQCMMKEICAQCLQRHVDPLTGDESFIFSCFNQDQNLDEVDFAHLATRLRQNSTAEKLTSLWIDYLFEARMVQEV